MTDAAFFKKGQDTTQSPEPGQDIDDRDDDDDDDNDDLANDDDDDDYNGETYIDVSSQEGDSSVKKQKSVSVKEDQKFEKKTESSGAVVSAAPNWDQIDPEDKRRYKEEMEKYDPAHVADLMYSRKERKIPGSVLKPHNPFVHLV